MDKLIKIMIILIVIVFLYWLIKLLWNAPDSLITILFFLVLLIFPYEERIENALKIALKKIRQK